MRQKKSLAELGKERTEAIVARLRSTMAEIDREISENDGVYPRNSGRLNVAELCRRAKVTAVSLHGEKHAGTTKLEVQAWLTKLRVDVPTSVKAARRKSYSQRLGWKERYDGISAQFKNMYSIEVVQRDAKIAALKKEISELKSQIKKQREAGSRVVGIESGRRRKASS